MITEEEHGRPAAGRVAERVLIDLLQLEREIAELQYVRRADALERAAEGVRRLGELGSAEGILAKAAAELGAAAQFDRVVISEVVDGTLRPLAVWDGTDQAAAAQLLADQDGRPVRLEYPLIEAEVVRHREATILHAGRGRARTSGPLAATWGWQSCVVAALTAQGETIGLLHADATAGGRTLDALDAEVAGKFAEGLSGVFERAVLRHTLELHRAELQSAGQWIGGRLSRLSDATAFESPRAATSAERSSGAVADSARAGGAAADGPRQHQPGHRQGAHGPRGHGQVPRQEHPAQARRDQPQRRGGAIRALDRHRGWRMSAAAVVFAGPQGGRPAPAHAPGHR